MPECCGLQKLVLIDADIGDMLKKLDGVKADSDQASGTEAVRRAIGQVKAPPKRPTIVFAHQRLDVKSNHGVKNAAQVRSVLEKSGRVIAVFQGHSHQNEHREISGIHYCVIAAMVEGTGPDNNGYATLDLFEDASLVINGFRRQQNYRWS